MNLTWVGVVVRLGAQPDLHLGHGAEGETQPEPATGHHHRRHQHRPGVDIYRYYRYIDILDFRDIPDIL